MLTCITKKTICSIRCQQFIVQQCFHNTFFSKSIRHGNTQNIKRGYSSNSESLPPNTKIHLIEPHPDATAKTIQYILLPTTIPFDLQIYHNDIEMKKTIQKEIIASIYAHRNILFGASMKKEGDESRNRLIPTCGPLLDRAISHAEKEGEQVQAISTLHGLCDWVANLVQDYEKKKGQNMSNINLESEIVQTILKDSVTFHAVKAIATNTPRQGHSVVGQGTYSDAKDAWMKLAKLYADQILHKKDEHVIMDHELSLYKSRGAESVAVEYLADTSTSYLKSAGGSMLRMYFM